MPNECRQSSFTRYPLADGTGTEILTWLDEHSRCVLSLTAQPAARTAHWKAAQPRRPPTKPGPKPSPATAGLVTLRHQGQPYHIGIGRPTPEPASCSWSRTCTSASSTPAPANSSANSPSTPTSATRPPGDHPAGQRKHRDPYAGSRCPRCLATSHEQRAWDSNPLGRSPVLAVFKDAS